MSVLEKKHNKTKVEARVHRPPRPHRLNRASHAGKCRRSGAVGGAGTWDDRLGVRDLFRWEEELINFVDAEPPRLTRDMRPESS